MNLLLLSVVWIVAGLHLQPDVPRFEPTACHPSVVRTGLAATCGDLIVPEDYDDPESRSIALAVVILHGETRTTDPLVFLRGGPGGISVPNFDTAFRQNYRPFLQDRDVIVFDQRGVAQLDCPESVEDSYALYSLPPRERTFAIQIEPLLACHDARIEAGYDPALYTTAQNARDVRTLRDVLGYDQLNLLGVSYGARLALTVLRDHPDIVRSALLDSPYPPQVALYEVAGENQRDAIRRYFNTCRADAACNAAFPDLAAQYSRVIRDLSGEPIPLTIPRPAGPVTILLDGGLFIQTITAMLYDSVEIQRIPLVVQALAEARDAGPITVTVQDLIERDATISEGMYYSVQCSEELPFSEFYATLQADPSELRRLGGGARVISTICLNWQTRLPGPIENEPVVSEIPSLVFSGQFDPVTPVTWGQLTVEGLTNGQLLIVPAIGHGVIRGNDCARQIAGQFVNAPGQPLDTACLEDEPAIRFNRSAETASGER